MTPKSKRPRPNNRAAAPSEVSITGPRRTRGERVLQRGGSDPHAAELETYERSPERGSEDARLRIDRGDEDRDGPM